MELGGFEPLTSWVRSGQVLQRGSAGSRRRSQAAGYSMARSRWSCDWGLRARTTKDIDLGRANDEEAATEHLNAAIAVNLDDFFDFSKFAAPRCSTMAPASTPSAPTSPVRAVPGRRRAQRVITALLDWPLHLEEG
jgi:hypothetical protein